MRICDVVLNSVWYDPRVRKQINEYIENDIEVCVVGLKCTRYNKEKIELIPCKTNVVEMDDSYLGHQKSILRKLQREKIIFEGVRNAIIEEKPDIIHANDLNALIPAYAAKKKLGCKLVYDSHEINTENYTKKKTIIFWIQEIIERYLVKRIDLMVCVSHAAAQYFANKYKIKIPMVVTNCALKKENAFDKGIEKNDGFEVINHGRFYRGRGYDIMAEACSLLKEYPEIHLALRGFGALEESLHQTVEKSVNKRNFRFYPPVTVQELIPMAAKAHVGVAITEPICLNFKLSVSNKIFEYVAAGLPVIMSDIPEHRYLNDKYSFGIILKENTPEEFADAAIKLYTDKEFYNTCAENAKKLAQEINWENEFKKLIYKEKELKAL